MNDFSFNPNDYAQMQEGRKMVVQNTPKFKDSENTMHIESDRQKGSCESEKSMGRCLMEIVWDSNIDG